MTKQLLASAVCVGLLTLAPGSATAQTQEAQTQRTIQGTVEAVDQKARTVTIRGSGGNVVTLDVPPNAERFDQVKVGVTVTGTFYDAVSIRLKPAGEAAVDQTMEPKTAATPGDLPGATRTRQRVTTVTITGWDPVNRVVSFTGPTGTAYTRGLLDTTDPKIVAGLKPGDRVDVTRTEAVTLLVLPSRDPGGRQLAEPPHGFGPVRVGQPVQRHDDPGSHGPDGRGGGHQPGRDDLRRGVRPDWNLEDRRRLSDHSAHRGRPELRVVQQRVGGDCDSDRHGRPGRAVPLTVNFTEYQYWGIEGGQRWFFARTRFTPFVGYLVGLNRHQDIRGTFVGVPANLTPGLAEQDGKFFEKSWAFSFGPTGGFLIGIGPIELMAETQLRFLGGLSDVDWLVEEGLRDINSESSRWSIPFMVGARIRF